MEDIFKNKVTLKVNIPDEKLHFICLFGAIMATIANVDGHFDELEKKALKKALSDRFDFPKKELNLLFEVISEITTHGVDIHEVTTELNNLTTYNEKVGMADCMFAVGGADGELSHDEAEEIRRITKAMRIPHKVFIDSKMKILSHLRKV